MADLTISLGSLLATYVTPHVPGIARGPYDTFIGLLPGSVTSKSIAIPFPDLGGAVADAGEAVAGALQPIQPAKALKALAEGLSEAEHLLNDRNLAVATGRLDIRMVVDVGGIAGAEANFTLNIGPIPEG